MPRRRYDILAVDLDGTLLGPTGKVSERNASAVREARRQGMDVVICTGRGLIESKHAIDAIEARTMPPGCDFAPIVVAGGALVSDAASGRTLHRWPMALPLVRRLVTRFAEERVATMVLKDPHAAGFDYLIVDTGELDPINLWWFERMGIHRRHVVSIEDDAHPEHTVRVGFAAPTDAMHRLGRRIMEEFRGETTMHHFAAVSGKVKPGAKGEAIPGAGDLGFIQSKPSDAQTPATTDLESRDESLHILEVFDSAVSKWAAVDWLARFRGVPRERVAAIGDEVNDLAMIKGAGLGIAMGNAVPAAREAASRHAPTNAEDGVAVAIDNILSGAW